MTTRATDTTGNRCICWPQYWQAAEAARLRRIRNRWIIAITPPWWSLAITGIIIAAFAAYALT